MRKIEFYLIFVSALLLGLLSACTSVEEKRAATVDLLNTVTDTVKISFYSVYDEHTLSYVDDEILSYMAGNDRFANLEQLNIYNTNNVTRNGLENLLKFRKLRRLLLYDSEIITAEDLQILSEQDTLTYLKIHNFDGVRELSLHDFDNLEFIDIQECNNLKAASFSNIPFCRNIQFWSCPGLTAKSTMKISSCNITSIFYCKCANLGQVNIVTNDSIGRVFVWSSYLAPDGFSKLKDVKGIETIDLDEIKSDSLVIPQLPDLEKVIYRDRGESDDTTLLRKLRILNSPSLLSIC